MYIWEFYDFLFKYNLSSDFLCLNKNEIYLDYMFDVMWEHFLIDLAETEKKKIIALFDMAEFYDFLKKILKELDLSNNDIEISIIDC